MLSYLCAVLRDADSRIGAATDELLEHFIQSRFRGRPQPPLAQEPTQEIPRPGRSQCAQQRAIEAGRVDHADGVSDG